jgi:hypothetical protein
MVKRFGNVRVEFYLVSPGRGYVFVGEDFKGSYQRIHASRYELYKGISSAVFATVNTVALARKLLSGVNEK